MTTQRPIDAPPAVGGSAALRTPPAPLPSLEPPRADPHRGVSVFADYRGDVRARCQVLVVPTVGQLPEGPQR